MLHFNSLVIENFGPFKGIQEIDFTEQSGVTIIWGNNGLGKTTLLNVFRFALFGKVLRRGSNLQSIKQIANWESYDEGIHGFRVVLSMKDNDTMYELTRQFVVKEGVTTPVNDEDYTEKVFLKRGKTFLSSEERQHVINSIMPEDVSRFFLFDGELLQEYEDLLTNESSSIEKIKEAIERILGVPVLTNGLSDIRTAEKDYSKQLSKVAQKNQSTQVLGNLLETKNAELKSHEDELSDLRNTLDDLNSQKMLIEEVMKQTEKAREWLNEKKLLNTIILKKQNQVVASQGEAKDLTAKAWQGMLRQNILNAIETIESDISRLDEIRKKHEISEQIIDQIKTACDCGECPICKQHLTDDLRSSLKTMNEFNTRLAALTPEDEAMLVSLMSRRQQLQNLCVEDIKQQIANIEKSIADVRVEISDAEQRVKEIDKNLSEYGNLDKISSINTDYSKCLMKIQNTDDGIMAEREIIERVTGEVKNIEEKLKQQATDAELIIAEEKRDICEQLRTIFELGVDLYRDKLKQKVETDASAIFVKISNQSEYQRLEINRNYGLSIIHNSGKNVEIRSSGYEHIVALSLIGALHKNAPLQGPIIMDSPFGRLDPGHKDKMIKALPSLAGQVVLLVYCGEIDEQHAREMLSLSLKNEYMLKCITAFNTQIEIV
jgi:DNA sulfur modification protein DndD